MALCKAGAAPGRCFLDVEQMEREHKAQMTLYGVDKISVHSFNINPYCCKIMEQWEI